MQTATIKKGARVEFRAASGQLICGVADSDEKDGHVNVRTAPANGIPGWGVVCVQSSDVVAHSWDEVE